MKKSRILGSFCQICAIFLFILVAQPAQAAASRAHPPRQRVIVLHDNHDNHLAAGIMIGVGISLVVYAITREYRDCSRLTYRF